MSVEDMERRVLKKVMNKCRPSPPARPSCRAPGHACACAARNRKFIDEEEDDSDDYDDAPDEEPREAPRVPCPFPDIADYSFYIPYL